MMNSRNTMLAFMLFLCLLANRTEAQIAFRDYASIDYSNDSLSFIVTIPNKFRYHLRDTVGFQETKEVNSTKVIIGKQDSGRLVISVDRHVSLSIMQARNVNDSPSVPLSLKALLDHLGKQETPCLFVRETIDTRSMGRGITSYNYVMLPSDAVPDVILKENTKEQAESMNAVRYRISPPPLISVNLGDDLSYLNGIVENIKKGGYALSALDRMFVALCLDADCQNPLLVLAAAWIAGECGKKDGELAARLKARLESTRDGGPDETTAALLRAALEKCSSKEEVQ